MPQIMGNLMAKWWEVGGGVRKESAIEMREIETGVRNLEGGKRTRKKKVACLTENIHSAFLVVEMRRRGAWFEFNTTTLYTMGSREMFCTLMDFCSWEQRPPKCHFHFGI